MEPFDGLPRRTQQGAQKTVRKFIFAIVGLALVTALGWLAYQRQGRPTTFESLYDEYQARGLRMGIQSPFNGAVLVARGNEVVFTRAYGFADDERGQALDLDSRFLIGAQAKPITAILVLQQIEAGVLALDGALTDYLPEFPAEPGSRVTLHHLLSHTAGLPRDAVDLDGLTLRHEPGTRYEFSNFGYDLLVAVLETATGRGYAGLLETGIRGPLALSNTGFAAGDELAAEVATGMNFEEYPYPVAMVATGVGAYTAAKLPAAGAFYTTVADLFRIVRALRGNELLSEAMTRRMFEPNLEGYAYAWARNREWAIEKNPGAPLYTHVGYISGYSALVAMYDDGLTVIVLANVEPLDLATLLQDTWLVANAVPEVATDLSRPSLSNPRAFQKDGGVEAFLGYYRALSERAGYPINPDPRSCGEVVRVLVRGDRFDEAAAFVEVVARNWPPETAEPLNTFGYLFLERERFDAAQRCFELNIELHPESANAHDSLGEFHERRGELELARQSYTRAVAIATRDNDRQADFYQRRLDGAD